MRVRFKTYGDITPIGAVGGGIAIGPAVEPKPVGPQAVDPIGAVGSHRFWEMVAVGVTVGLITNFIITRFRS